MTADVDIAAAARDGGFATRTDIQTAVAIALAESGGNNLATNRNDNGSTDYGLWQINSVHTDILKIGDWRNPTDNAKMAKKVFDKQGWSAWVVYDTGRYKDFMARANTAVAVLAMLGKLPDIIERGLDGPQLPGADALDDIKKFVQFFGDKHNWQRIGYISAGVVLLFIAILAMIKANAGDVVGAVAGKAVGKVVKGVVK